MSAQTTILMTGANRGIGRAITTTYLTRPNHTIIALTRNPASSTSQSLTTEPRHQTSTLLVLPYDASDPTSADTTISHLTTHHPEITHLSIVIANAGFSGHFGPSLDADPQTYINHYTVNTLAPLLLFRACLPLLTSTSASNPTEVKSKFIAITSDTGSIARLNSASMRRDLAGKPCSGALPYTSSKCALNHVMVKLAMEYPEVMVGLFTPGPTKTGFGGEKVDWKNVPGARDVERVVEGLVALFEELGKVEGNEEGTEERLRARDWSGRVIDW